MQDILDLICRTLSVSAKNVVSGAGPTGSPSRDPGRPGRLGLSQCVVLTRLAALAPMLLTCARRCEWAPVLWERLDQVLPRATVSWASTESPPRAPACLPHRPSPVCQDSVSSCRGSWAGGGFLTCVYTVLRLHPVSVSKLPVSLSSLTPHLLVFPTESAGRRPPALAAAALSPP